jgi:conjugative relaxase-like TrwC/TraI family protein
MLSIGKLRIDAEAYYLELVVSGIDEYYSERGEVPGRWVGAGVDGLGLVGQVAGDDLRAVLRGLDPASGETLSPPRTVPGFDLTFSAPKSVSLLFGLSQRDLAVRIVAAHDLAAGAALGYLEQEACLVRRGHAGARQLAGDGFVGAAFRHRTSRAGDPQLHTHVLVANLARGGDGAWSALDARLLYRQLRTAGYLYQAHLRHELTRQLGVAWGPVARGSAELADVPTRVLEAFSRRRAEITQAMAHHGATSRHGAQIAALATRAPKDRDADVITLRHEWQQRSQALGFQPGQVRLFLERSRAHETGPDHRLLAAALTEEQSTFDEPAVLRAIAEQARAGAAVEQAQAQASDFLANPEIVRVAAGLYTTQEMLRLERRVVAVARARVDEGTAVVPRAIVQHAFGGLRELSREQRAMVQALTTAGHGVDVVVGVAGAGKTQALAAARLAWTTAGYDVRGAALAARAAAELETRAQVPATSLDALLATLDRSQSQLSARTVVVLDEAAMIGTRKLARLLAHADHAHAKVVLVGDDHQLPEIQAGGAFRGLAHRLPSVRLTENRRQRDPHERDALAELRAGRADRALQHLTSRGRISTTPTRADAHAEMINRWLAARRNGDDVVMLAARRSDVQQLNQRAQAALVAAGQLTPPSLEVRGHRFTVGDRVMTLHNWPRHRIVNGARGTLTAIAGSEVSLQFDAGHHMTLPPTYLQAGHLTHAYAMTIHKAQGLTADRCLVLADDTLSREAAYTALSRGRLENRLVVIHPEDPLRDIRHGPPGRPADPIARLFADLRNSRAKTMAIDMPELAPTLAPMRRPGPGIGLGR